LKKKIYTQNRGSASAAAAAAAAVDDGQGRNLFDMAYSEIREYRSIAPNIGLTEAGRQWCSKMAEGAAFARVPPPPPRGGRAMKLFADRHEMAEENDLMPPPLPPPPPHGRPMRLDLEAEMDNYRGDDAAAGMDCNSREPPQPPRRRLGFLGEPLLRDPDEHMEINDGAAAAAGGQNGRASRDGEAMGESGVDMPPPPRPPAPRGRRVGMLTDMEEFAAHEEAGELAGKLFRPPGRSLQEDRGDNMDIDDGLAHVVPSKASRAAAAAAAGAGHGDELMPDAHGNVGGGRKRGAPKDDTESDTEHLCARKKRKHNHNHHPHPAVPRQQLQQQVDGGEGRGGNTRSSGNALEAACSASDLNSLPSLRCSGGGGYLACCLCVSICVHGKGTMPAWCRVCVCVVGEQASKQASKEEDHAMTHSLTHLSSLFC